MFISNNFCQFQADSVTIADISFFDERVKMLACMRTHILDVIQLRDFSACTPPKQESFRHYF